MSADGNIELEFTSQDAKLDLALGKIDARLRSMEQSFGRVGKSSKQASKEGVEAAAAQEAKLKEFQAQNEKVVRGIEATAAAARKLIATPLEQFAAKERELSQAVLYGKLTIDEKTRALAVYRKELFSAQEAGENAFGTQMIARLAAYTAGVVTLQKAVHVVKAAWNEENEAARRALETARSMTEPNKDLAQLSDGTAGSVERLYARRDELAQRFGIDRKETTDTLFAAKSAELSDKQTEIAMLAGHLGDASESAQLMGSIKNFRKGEISPEAALNVMLKASADSPKLNFKDFSRLYPSTDTAAKALGLSVEDTVAMITKMSGNLGTPEETFERARLLMGHMSVDERFKGKGLAAFETLRDMSEDERKDFLGERITAWEAFRAENPELAGIRDYSKELSEIAAQTGTEKDALKSQVRQKFEESPVELGKLKADRANIHKEVSRENNLAVDEAARQQALDEELARIEEQKMPWYERAGATWFAQGAVALRMDPKEIRRLAHVGRGLGHMIGENTFDTDEMDKEYLDREAAIARGAGGDSQVLDSVLGQNEQQTQLLQEIRDAVIDGNRAPASPPDHVPAKE